MTKNRARSDRGSLSTELRIAVFTRKDRLTIALDWINENGRSLDDLEYLLSIIKSSEKKDKIVESWLTTGAEDGKLKFKEGRVEEDFIRASSSLLSHRSSYSSNGWQGSSS